MSDLGDRLHGGLKRVLADAEESAKAAGRSIADTFADDQSGNRKWRVLVIALAQYLEATGGEVSKAEIGLLFGRYKEALTGEQGF